MFTGLIETVGRITRIEQGDQSILISIVPGMTPYDVAIGDSVAINGVCLTIEVISGTELTFRAVRETMQRTSLGKLTSGSVVNLERAMLASGRLDGHIVQGHVDTMATLISIEPAGDSVYYVFQPEQSYMRYIAEKGSVAIDGISLTVAKITASTFSVALIPHTIKNTSLQNLGRGSQVNIECDVLARYIEQLMKFGVTPKPHDGELINLLERNGF